jgi:predicted transcriptional regulator
MPKDAKDIKQMFLQKKPCQILLAASRLEKPYVSLLMKEADTTFAHTTNILSEMESYGLIGFVSEGRVKYVKLTVPGRELARSLRSVDNLLDGKTLFKKLLNIERNIDRLEENLKSEVRDERSLNVRRKRLDDIVERVNAIDAESSRYNNGALTAAIAHANERLDYLKTKIQRQETTPQDTLNP